MNNSIFLSIYIFAILISSFSQILLKMSAGKVYPKKINEYFNAYVIIGNGIFFISTLLSVYSYKGIELKDGPVLQSLGFVFVMIFGRIILKEKFTYTKLLGNLFIICGIIVFN